MRDKQVTVAMHKLQKFQRGAGILCTTSLIKINKEKRERGVERQLGFRSNSNEI
jgi:hypothetical protein